MSSSLKYHLDNRFRTCHAVAQAHDMHRNRQVTLFLLPGRFDLVGVSDTIDVWVAPVSADPFSVNIKRVLDDIQAGKPLHEIVVVPKRKSLNRAQIPSLLGAQPDTQAPPPRKRREPTPAVQEPEIPVRRRRQQ